MIKFSLIVGLSVWEMLNADACALIKISWLWAHKLRAHIDNF